MQRATIGLVSLALLILGVALYYSSLGELWHVAGGNCLKLGAVAGAWWLAYPSLLHLPHWLVPLVILGMLVGIRWPKLLPWIALALVIMWFVRPRTRVVR